MIETTLREKGWNEQEITRAQSILEHRREHEKHFSQIILWSALIVILFGNLMVTLILVPFLPLMSLPMAIIVTIILATSMGFLYNLLINDIGHLEKKHHIAAGIIMPILALFNMFLVVLISNKFNSGQLIANTHNPWILGIVFGIMFITPYLGRKLITSKPSQ
jgi:Kef-type K+ transport system membrane component KefB